MAFLLPKAVETFGRAMLSSRISQNNTGLYAQLTEANSDMIASCLNASHSSLNSSSAIALFARYATIELLGIEYMAEISPVLFHTKLDIAVDIYVSAKRVLFVEMVGIIMSPMLFKYESSLNLYYPL